MRVLRGRLSIYECASFGFEGGIWDLIALISDHCLPAYFAHVLVMPGRECVQNRVRATTLSCMVGFKNHGTHMIIMT